MTAALQLTAEISRRLRGRCRRLGGGLLSKDGEVHADCSTCFLRCGDPNDLGLADAGFALIQDWRGLHLRWKCPQCGGDTHEETELMTSTKDAQRIAADATCSRCRNGK